ncbi:oxidoreductase, short-chain dehydrogenase/reductase family [Aspergillus ibericus CBS 121593]|uniref:Short-chain dehydrogenase/oxidoreductase n=1 Tax=Aspergillus ibericus CBS 121593 TaxID=1448316 RepID=A0A395GPS8_9EURO|nr:short-chain dehydrogenase/oxidoreductase [Aspergillus ibericus CBS 121593]RAK97374.1 short-chain dehydrogenase/oxidoreductase [Aspergillus ibericus CBS 121593]
MAFPYKHFLIIGATAGIGRALASRLVQSGAKVTAVGRRKERLDEFVSEHGTDKANGVQFDIGELDKIPEFAAEIIRQYPDIDSIFLNAGIQHSIDLTDPESFNLPRFHEEMRVNFSSLVALTHAFLPFLTRKEGATSFIYTSSNLAIVPAVWAPAYSASKAALNAFLLCLRDQLRNSSIKVIEVSPPAVQTELHDYMGEEKGRSFGIPLEEFTEEAFRGLTEGKDQVIVGSFGPADVFNEIVDKRRAAFTNMCRISRGEK